MQTARGLSEWVEDARQRTFDLIADLSDRQLMTERIEIVNPLLWEIGHVAWFQEKWVLRESAGEAPAFPEVDALYDSIAIPHDIRWDLPLYTREKTIAYLENVRDRVLARLEAAEPSERLAYFVLVTLFHEDMHNEAFTYTRQTLGYPAPRVPGFADRSGAEGSDPAREAVSGNDGATGDAELPGGEFALGASRSEPFVFDNEKWSHPVGVKPFAISRRAVTQGEFAGFVESEGYARRDLWSDEGWRWRVSAAAGHPVYWRPEGGGRWLRRDFDEWRPLEEDLPVIHVNRHEAEAYCRWAKRRLPTEAEWEMAAAGEPGPEGAGGASKRRFPWGDDPPTPEKARLDWQGMGCAPVHAYATGSSACGCRQMIGNVWEWTASDFLPYPGFEPDPYKEYSAPWFGTHKVLRGGSWATRSRLLRNTWRNYYKPDRRDVWAGFRTCAV